MVFETWGSTRFIFIAGLWMGTASAVPIRYRISIHAPMRRIWDAFIPRLGHKSVRRT